MRQWDTKLQFKPRYRLVAEIVFLGWWKYPANHEWVQSLSELWDGMRAVAYPVFGTVLMLFLFITSPITFPLLCLVEQARMRRRRLNYLKSNRRADRDI